MIHIAQNEMIYMKPNKPFPLFQNFENMQGYRTLYEINLEKLRQILLGLGTFFFSRLITELELIMRSLQCQKVASGYDVSVVCLHFRQSLHRVVQVLAAYSGSERKKKAWLKPESDIYNA